ncbi:MAG: tRNA (adenine(58)-N(1))-methyltransferase non-catalytic subunit trm6 [Cirrosporium novae-zelandiae]|nr:MAG: tRNA (adenine(58)-N(1))-methyltransferase non-catalytic subunit trm6 [Cirrosporium novae-zelandiae]
MPAYHSVFLDDPEVRVIGNFALLPLRTRTRGPAYTLPPLPAGTSDLDVDPSSESYDPLDEVISLFRANTFFRNFEIKGPADRLLIYGILFVSECLGKLNKGMGTREAEKVLTNTALDQFAIPGDASFPLNQAFETPSNRQDAETLRQYISQVRQELAQRLLARIYADGTNTPSKWWLSFTKRKFMGKSLTISLGKYGIFQVNQILGRPYNITFEIVEKQDPPNVPSLRIVPASELNAEALTDLIDEEASTPPLELVDEPKNESVDGTPEYELVENDGKVVMRTNQHTIDDPSRQKLTMEDIEALKKDGTSGKDIISKVLASHSAIDQKTAFSLAKYTLRKAKKYLKRFTVLPLDVPTLTNWMLSDKEPMKIMEMREELMALVGSWANIHYGGANRTFPTTEDGVGKIGGGRWLVVDETGGLLIAAMAERMGILYPHDKTSDSDSECPNPPPTANPPSPTMTARAHPKKHNHPLAMGSPTNTLTLLHSAAQPNLSLLRYFHFDANEPSHTHPLYTHLKTLSWLQLLHPGSDSGYAEPALIPDDVLKTWKTGKRSSYFRKRRRWTRIKNVVDETRAGGFDGLIISAFMSPVSILQHCVPLLAGAAHIVVYSPTIEPLTHLADLYSTARRAAFQLESDSQTPPTVPSEEWPVNPTLLLAPTIHTARVQRWQALPGRTHPVMSDRGGADGYMFCARRVVPAEGKVEARGRYKRRKVEKAEEDNTKRDVDMDVVVKE